MKMHWQYWYVCFRFDIQPCQADRTLETPVVCRRMAVRAFNFMNIEHCSPPYSSSEWYESNACLR